MRLAYSYTRFSTPEQRHGDSKRRQLERTEAFAKENGLVLDTSLKLIDEGISAHKGKHRKEGALGRFLKAVEEGQIPPSSVLIVESLDRLSREDIDEALLLFMGILRAGIDIVSLIDNQWYSKESIKRNPSALMISLVVLWRANDESRTKVDRLTRAWEQKRLKAVEGGVPMTAVCPGWLRLAKDRRSFEPIPERVKLVKLMFWLSLRGWGKQRIARLLQTHKVPTWGVKGKAANSWHHSYVQKILMNRAVLGEHVLWAKRDGVRTPVTEPLKGYYPPVIDPTVFVRVQARGPGPKGPLGKNLHNLFRGLVYDGEYPESRMWFKDHGDAEGKWRYLVSDYSRVHPGEPKFSWSYPRLELLLLRYLCDLDWPSLQADRGAELRTLDRDIEAAEGEAKVVGTQLKRLVSLVQAGADVEEAVTEIARLKGRRKGLQDQLTGWRAKVAELRRFDVAGTATMLRMLAQDVANMQNRTRLRDAIRLQVERIELYRKIPGDVLNKLGVPRTRSGTGLMLSEFLQGRCVRIRFRNGAERWVADRGDAKGAGLRFDPKQIPTKHLVILENDELGGKAIRDMSKQSSKG